MLFIDHHGASHHGRTAVAMQSPLDVEGIYANRISPGRFCVGGDCAYVDQFARAAIRWLPHNKDSLPLM